MKVTRIIAIASAVWTLASASASAAQLNSHGQWVAIYGAVNCAWATTFLAPQGLSPAPAAQQPFPGQCAMGLAFEKTLDTQFASTPGSYDFDIYYWAILVNNPASAQLTWYFLEFRADEAFPLQRWKHSIGYPGNAYKLGEIQWDVSLDTFHPVNGLETIGEKKMKARKANCTFGCQLVDVTFGATPAGGFAKGVAVETPLIVTPKHLGTHNVVSSTAGGLQYTRPYNPALGDSITYPAGSAVAQFFTAGSFTPVFWAYVPDLNFSYLSYAPF